MEMLEELSQKSCICGRGDQLVFQVSELCHNWL